MKRCAAAVLVFGLVGCSSAARLYPEEARLLDAATAAAGAVGDRELVGCDDRQALRGHLHEIHESLEALRKSLATPEGGFWRATWQGMKGLR